MNLKKQWIEDFEELLWQYHGDSWKEANHNMNYPLQLAVAYFDWDYDAWGNCTVPERTPEEAFAEYLKGCNLELDNQS